MKQSAVVIIGLLLVLTFLGLFFLVRGGQGPQVIITPQPGPISARQTVVLTIKSPAGLEQLSMETLQGEKSYQILAKKYPSGTTQIRESVNLAAAGLKEGPVRLIVKATDRSFAHFGAGNRTENSYPFVYDNKPPAISVLSTSHNIARGGVGLVVYTLNKEVQKSGIVFADRFYPGYRQKSGNYACLFPFPFDINEQQFQPKVFAVDLAGNERRAGIYFHLIPKAFRSDRIALTDSFLEKVAAEFKDKFPKAATPLEIFLKANQELRQQDAKTLHELGLKTSPVPLWKDEFLRLPNSAPKGTFAQKRTYLYQGKVVDQQTHLGVDLASLPHAPVPAANSGTVVYADYLGIYGQCVIIDHGMGLQSLYGHLSQIGSKVGDTVQKETIIGRTGDTGLAGGDHLHFGMIVSGEQVNPIEWWDAKWIENNVTSKLE